MRQLAAFGFAFLAVLSVHCFALAAWRVMLARPCFGLSVTVSWPRRCMSITRRAACCKLSHRFPGRLEQLADSRARAALGSGAGNALDVRSDGLEFLDDTLVAPVDVVDAVDNGFAFRDKSGEDEARAGTKIRSLDDGA